MQTLFFNGVRFEEAKLSSSFSIFGDLRTNKSCTSLVLLFGVTSFFATKLVAEVEDSSLCIRFCMSGVSSWVVDFEAFGTLVDLGEPDADLLVFATAFLPGASVGDTDI